MDRYAKCYFFDKHDIERAEVIKLISRVYYVYCRGRKWDMRMACVCVGEIACALRVFARFTVPFPFRSQMLATDANKR